MADYKIRERTRRQASPRPGHRQEWDEVQVTQGRKIVSRHGTRSEAERKIEELKAKESSHG